MKWNRFTVKTKTEAEDIVISTLAEVGIEGVEIQDKQPLTESDKQQMFVDIMPDIPDDDGIAYLNFYLDVDGKLEGILGNASIFGVSLYTAGLADKVTADVKELLAGPGAVRATLKKHLA